MSSEIIFMLLYMSYKSKIILIETPVSNLIKPPRVKISTLGSYLLVIAHILRL